MKKTIQIETDNVGLISVDQKDADLVLEVDALASDLYFRDAEQDDSMSGADYFEELADEYGLQWELVDEFL